MCPHATAEHTRAPSLSTGYLSSCMYFISKGKVLVVERPADENAAPQAMSATGEVDHASQLEKTTEAPKTPAAAATAGGGGGGGLSKLALLKSAAKRVQSGTRDDYFGERGLFSAEEQRAFDETRAGQSGQTRYDTSARAITHSATCHRKLPRLGGATVSCHRGLPCLCRLLKA